MAISGTLSADGNTDVIVVVGAEDGDVGIVVSGTWGSGTFKMQFYDGAWKDFPGSSKTADASYSVNLPAGGVVICRGNLSGATGPTLYWRYFGNVVKYTGATLS